MIVADCIRAIQAAGFTPRQARFLVLVLEHAGVCLPRQYRAFGGIAHGRQTHQFFQKLTADGFATTDLAAPAHAGRLYHLQYKLWYRLLGEPDHRHRRPMSVWRAVERLMVLDGVLAEPKVTWLGLSRDKVAAFTVPGTPPPGAFTLTAPASGATNQPTSVTLAWGASSGAASYAYCLDTTLNGACNGTWPSVGAATSATVSGLTAGATYEWQVRATNATGTTEATGAWRTFTVAAAAPLVKTSPASGTTGLGSPVILTWTSTLMNVAYTVCWDQTPDGTCSGVWWPNGQSLVKWLENLAPGTYYWQVRAQTPTGYVYADGENTYWSFTVGSALAAETEPTGGAGAAASSGGMTGNTGAGTPPPIPGRAGGAGWLLLAAGLAALAWRRPRQGRRRAWALPAWVSLVALLWPAGMAAQTPGTRVEYYHLDALGSVRVVTDASGQVVRRHDFGPFGEEVAPTHPNPERKLFTGQERDAETALDYFGARYYRADLGRFTARDPGHVGGDVGDPQSWNAYAYARNNPLQFVDPDGLAYRVVVQGGKSAVWYLDDREFEWIVAHPELNPGISFNDGVITAGGKTVGSYQHFSDSDAMIGLAGDLSAYGLRREGQEMAAWAASGAIGGVVTGALRGGLAAEEVLGIGRVAAGSVTPSSGQVAQMQRVFVQQGRKGVEKALRTLEQRLAEHLSKIDAARAAGGYTSSIEREVSNFRQLITAARQILGK